MKTSKYLYFLKDTFRGNGERMYSEGSFHLLYPSSNGDYSVVDEGGVEHTIPRGVVDNKFYCDDFMVISPEVIVKMRKAAMLNNALINFKEHVEGIVPTNVTSSMAKDAMNYFISEIEERAGVKI